MTAFVLVHGGGFDGRCWDLVTPHLDGPVLAVDLPGRGTRPMPFDQVDLRACADAVAADVAAAGFEAVVLVGHSLAGCTLPGALELLADRVRHVVFVACTVPEDGSAAVDTLDPEVQELVGAQVHVTEPSVMDESLAHLVLGDDLDEAQFAWCVERLVPEAPRLVLDPVDLSPLRRSTPRTWIRTQRDGIVDAAKQLGFATNVGDCPVVDLDAGHMCMVSHPTELAEIIGSLARPD